MTRALRLIAFAIAIAGVDPAIALTGASRARLALVTPTPAWPAAEAVRDRLTAHLTATYEIVPQLVSDAAAAIVIGEVYPADLSPADGRARAALSDALLVATVTIPDPVTPGARIVRVDAPREVPDATVIHLDVEIDASGVEDQTTDVAVVMAGLEVGRASHRWAATEKRWRASIDAVPIGEPPYVLSVRLKPDTTNVSAGNPVMSGVSGTVADVVVDARRAPFRVEFYDPRPSWATTFVRRALEADARFQVAALSFTSRGITSETGGAVALGDPRLAAFDVVVAGGLDRLTAADGRGLERFLRERGGSVVVIPDQRVDGGPARDFLAGLDLAERLLERPAKLTVVAPAPPFQASELLVLRAMTPGADVVGRIPGNDASRASVSSRAEASDDASAVIVSVPRGEGRLLFSGAMDAWRFRAADNGAFDRFWQSTIAGLAMAVPSPAAIDIDPPLLRPGERGEVIVRVRAGGGSAVSATLDGDQPVRLTPEPEEGVFRGRFAAKAEPGRSTLEVHVSGARPVSAARTFLVRPVQRLRSTAAPSLSMLAASHRGIHVSPDHLADLERFLRGAVPAAREQRLRHPMRSAWWIVPFAACLSAEWWLRRRRGLR